MTGGMGKRGKGGGGEERRAINDALEHVTLRNASAAICRHIYYLGDTSIRPLIIILITAARKLLRMCGCSHDSVINKYGLLLISERAGGGRGKTSHLYSDNSTRNVNIDSSRKVVKKNIHLKVCKHPVGRDQQVLISTGIQETCVLH